MTRPPLIDEDRAFLQRLEPARKRVTFAHYVLGEIRGVKWRPEQYRGLKATNPAYILQEVTARLRAQVKRGVSWEAHKAQWLQALSDYPDEALRYVHWCLAWEQRSPIEKRAYQWRQYQAWQQAQQPRPPVAIEASGDLTLALNAFARQRYGFWGALEHSWHDLLEAYMEEG